MRKRTVWFWIKTLLIAFFIAWFLRAFIVESYHVPACSMENTLTKGDRIFVSKLSYGIRLPMTILAIPFCQDSIQLFGIKSYSTYYTFPYTRIFRKDVKRNDVVVFNNPTNDFTIPIDKQKISVSRCFALPGDSLVFRDNMVYINGAKKFSFCLL